MPKHKIYEMSFAKIYPCYIAKVEKKNRTKAEVDKVIAWLTGYDADGLRDVLANERSMRRFFADAPRMNPARHQITGKGCGIRLQDIENPLMQDTRYMDKLVDEIAKGRPTEKVLREPVGTA